MKVKQRLWTETALAGTFGKMANIMSVFGRKIRCMAKESSFCQTEMKMKAYSKMINLFNEVSKYFSPFFNLKMMSKKKPNKAAKRFI